MCSNTQPKGVTSIGCSRSFFSGWVDTDGDCKDTRAEMLIASSSVPVAMRRGGCSVCFGRWYDLYSGVVFDDARDVEIDHVGPLAWAWAHGASAWSKRRADKFALDPENLMVVSSVENRSKSSSGPDAWMPLNKAYHCQYVRKFVSIAVSYGLTVSAHEKRRIRKIEEQSCTA